MTVRPYEVGELPPLDASAAAFRGLPNGMTAETHFVSFSGLRLGHFESPTFLVGRHYANIRHALPNNPRANLSLGNRCL
jgi:hypothetical protein